MELPQDLNIMDKTKNLGVSIVNWATTDRFARVSDEQFAERKAICTACPFWDGEGFNHLGKCKLCGCSGLKLYIPSAKCPAVPQRWAAVSVSDNSHNPPA